MYQVARSEDISEDVKLKYLEYSKCDVLGLEELYNKLNNILNSEQGKTIEFQNSFLHR